MGKPKISIIVPMYNVEKYICQCASSLFGQTYDNMEYVFVDDCSNDGTVRDLKDCLSKHPQRKEQVKILFNCENRGVAFTRNVGLRNATGDYIGWCDADDWVEADMFEGLLESILKANADLAYCHYFEEGSCRRTVKVADISNPDKEKRLCEYLEKGPNTLWNKLASRRLYADGKVEFLDGFDYCEDFNVSTKLLYNAQKVACFDKVCYHYRMNMASICHSFSKEKCVSGFRNVADVYAFLKSEGMGGRLQRYMTHNMLNAKLALWTYCKDIASLQIYPETNSLVFSNPFLGIKGRVAAFTVCTLYKMMLKVLNAVKL